MARKYFFLFLFLFSSIISQAEDGEVSGQYPFVINLGQWDHAVQYKLEFGSNALFFESNALQYQFTPSSLHNERHGDDHQHEESDSKKGMQTIRIEFEGSNKLTNILPSQPAPYYYNYFIGNDPAKWKSDVKPYDRIQYQNIYEKTSLRYYLKNDQLKYDFILEPGGDPLNIRMNIKGADQIKLEEGELHIHHHFGMIIEESPYAYVIQDGEKVEVASEFYFIDENTVGIRILGEYDPNSTLIIDPAIVFSTYSGYRADNFGMTATYDASLNGYMGGTIFSPGYNSSTLIGYDSTFNGGATDIAISKFSSNGNNLRYSTFLGGQYSEAVNSMVVNSSQELIILGISSSANYPITANALKPQKTNSISLNYSNSSGYGLNFTTGTDMVLTKLSQDGKILRASTFYGGAGTDGMNFDRSTSNSYLSHDTKLNYNYGDHFRGEIIVGDGDTVFIGASTHSPNLDTTNTTSLGGPQDGLVAKISPDLDKEIWFRYLGGSEYDAVYSLKVTNKNKLLIGGGTRSFSNFPVTSGSYNSTSFGGRSDGFACVMSQSGQILHSTFIGSSSYDQVYFVENDRDNNFYVLGQTSSPNYPIINSSIANASAGQFIMEFDSTLSQVLFSHTFGDGRGNGTINISPTAFLVDYCQNIYVSGWGGDLGSDGAKTLTNNMPLSDDHFSDTTDNNDFYFYVVNNNLDSLIYGSYLGATNSADHVDGGTSRFSKSGVIFQSICASCSGVNDFPTSPNSAFPTERGPRCNNALLKFDFQILPIASFDIDTNINSFCLKPGDSISLHIIDNSLRASTIIWSFNGDTSYSKFSDTTIVIRNPGTYNITQFVEDTVCNNGDFRRRRIYVYPDDIVLDAITDTTICSIDSVELNANGTNANQYIWSDDPYFSNPFDTTATPFLKIKMQAGIDTFYVQATNTITQACPQFDTLVVNYVPVIYEAIIGKDTICENSSVSFSSSTFNIDKYKWDFDNGILDSTNQSRTINYPNPGDYTISFAVENNVCNSKDTLLLDLHVVDNDIILNPIPDTLACRLDSITLTQTATGTGINSYLWSSNSNFTDTLNNYPSNGSLKIDQEGSSTFFIKVSNRYCYIEDQIDVDLVPFKLDLEPLPDESCSPFIYEISTTIVNADSFRIFLGDGSSTNIDQTPVLNYTEPGLYTVSLLGYNQQCNIADTIESSVPVYQGVELDFLEDTVICADSSLPLSILHGQTATSFIWSTDPNFQNPLNGSGDSTIIVSPNLNTIYYYKGVNGICQADSSIQVDVNEILIDLVDFESICFEDTITLNSSVTSNFPPYIFNWSPNSEIISGQNTSMIQVSPSADVRYYLTVTDQLQCKDSSSSLVEVNIPRFEDAEIISSADSIFKGQSIQLSTNRNLSGLNYSWSPAEYFNDPYSSNPELKLPLSGMIQVTITDQQTGCEVTAQKWIGVAEINCSIPDIFVPSAFTPNGDGNNDVVYVRGVVIDTFEFSIYNRWGELVFRTTSQDLGWDGTYKGKKADPGVFVYHLTVECFDGQEYTDKGNITLIR